MAVRILTRQEVASLLSLKEALTIVEQVFAEHALGRTATPPVLALPVDSHRGEIDVKLCYLDGSGIAGGKIVSFYEGNAGRGLPSVMGTILLLDGTSGELLSVMDGGHITTMRTGALGALSAKYLARRSATVVGVLGAGAQARIQLEALKMVCPGLAEARAYSRTPERTQAYAEEMESKLGIPVRVAGSAREMVQGADIVITATNARAAVIKDAWLPPGVHIIDVGADGEGMQELEPAIFGRARVFCDSLEQCAAIGELQHPLKLGIISREQVTEIGDVIIGAAAGRQADDEITVFDTTGVAIQDLAAAHHVYQAAEAVGLGTVVDLSGHSQPPPTMRHLGDTLDHLATSTMGFEDWPPRGQLDAFYQAARRQTGGDPISWSMAKALLRATRQNKTVIVATGEYEPNQFRRGETDGPMGIAVLARVLSRLGHRIVFVCDPILFAVHQAIVDPFVGGPVEYVAFPGGTGLDYKDLAADLLEQYEPVALIACEKLSRNIAGEYHGAFGTNCSAHENRVDHLFDLAFEQGRLTLSFGDQGNEIGFGNIRETVLEVAPYGRRCQCPCQLGIAAVTRTSFLLPCTVSNWGAIALADMLAVLVGRQDLVHTEGRHRWLQELLLENEVIDGALGIVSRSVDSIDGDVDLALVRMLEAASLRSLTTKNAFFGKARGRGQA